MAEHWLRFGIDGWRLDVPSEIDDEAFWQEFRRRCRAVRPDAYLVGEIWRVAPDWLRGDRFDALMNYPLGEAILGFAGGATWTWTSSAATTSTPRSVRPLDGPAFADGSMELAAAYDPDVVRGPAQPPRLARRAAAADDAGRRRRRASGSRRCSR